MRTERILVRDMKDKPEGFHFSCEIFYGEIKGLEIELVSIKGEILVHEVSKPDNYDVLLTLDGEGIIEVEGEKYKFSAGYIIRPPYKRQYIIQIENGKEVHFLRYRKSLDEGDIRYISSDFGKHNKIFIKALSECPVYTEDIKSNKTINRMILPEGLVPRFCVGSVQTEGPDGVAEHVHPMLDQLFLGLDKCNVTCYANGEQTSLTENMLLHIPLGSTHSVSVEKGETLSYIWLDFFLTLEGQKYMNEQHHIKDD